MADTTRFQTFTIHRPVLANLRRLQSELKLRHGGQWSYSRIIKELMERGRKGMLDDKGGDGNDAA